MKAAVSVGWFVIGPLVGRKSMVFVTALFASVGRKAHFGMYAYFDDRAVEIKRGVLKTYEYRSDESGRCNTIAMGGIQTSRR